MSIYKIAQSVEKIGSETSLQSWDNTGILIDSRTPESSEKKILLCIDFTLAVLEECIQQNIKYVVAYHPCIFHPLKKLTDELYIKSIQNYISVYSPHTYLDDFMNNYILKLLGANPGTLDQIISKIKEIFSLDKIRIVRSDRNMPFNNDGDIIVGVGAAFRNVNHKNCLLITGEMSHHDLLKCKFSKTDVIMLEHSNSERIILPEIKRIFENNPDFKDYEVFISSRDSDPVQII